MRTPSTNADVSQRARAGEPEGLVLVTDHQTAGRGRLDRTWETPAGTALTMSVLLRPQPEGSRWPWLPLLTGLAVVEGLGALGVAARLKWPNDVLVDGRKLAGILVERIDSPQGPAAVVGLGLNVSMSAEQLPVETATSLRVAGHELTREQVRDAVLAALAERYDAWSAAPDDGDLRAAYRERCVTAHGQAVRAELPDGRSLAGTGCDIGPGGELVVRLEDGERRSVSSGDVVHLRQLG